MTKHLQKPTAPTWQSHDSECLMHKTENKAARPCFLFCQYGYICFFRTFVHLNLWHLFPRHEIGHIEENRHCFNCHSRRVGHRYMSGTAHPHSCRGMDCSCYRRLRLISAYHAPCPKQILFQLLKKAASPRSLADYRSVDSCRHFLCRQLYWSRQRPHHSDRGICRTEIL